MPMGDLIMNVVGGLLAGLIGIFSQNIWIKIVIPWFEDRVYKDAKIEGDWGAVITYPDHTTHYTFKLNRQGHRIYGQIEDVNHNHYPLEGEFRKRVLTLTYESPNPSSMDRGCFAFTLDKGGKMLSGYGAYYHPDPDRIVNPQAILTRKSE